MLVKVVRSAPVAHTCGALQRLVQTTTRIFQNHAYCDNLFLTNTMSQDKVTGELTERDQKEHRRDDVLARERASTRGARMDLGLLSNWTMDDYRRECADFMDVKRFSALAVVGKSLEIYDRSSFERNTALGACKRCCAVLSWWCGGILVDTRFADMPLVRCEQKLPYCPRVRNTIDANMDVVEGDPELRCSFFDRPYTNMYLMCGGTHWTKALEFEIRQRTPVRSSIFVRWRKMDMFAVSLKYRHCHYVFAPAIWRNWKAIAYCAYRHLLCLRTS